MSGIEWTEKTWNPVVGCTPVSEGCRNCYAATMARGLEAMGKPQYAPRVEGDRTYHVAEVRSGRAVFTGEVRELPERLLEPMKVKKPTLWFVNSMSDLFHERVSFDFVDRVLAVVAMCPQHTFQVLTKRPERMARYFGTGASGLKSVRLGVAARDLVGKTPIWPDGGLVEQAIDRFDRADGVLPNLWLGTSVEDQETVFARVPWLARTPAIVRFLSCEPLLGPVDICTGRYGESDDGVQSLGGLDWVIVGGESGPNARPCERKWIESIVEQCLGADVPCFVKQLGSDQCLDDRVSGGKFFARPKDRKGADPAEWPKALRVRQMPHVWAGAHGASA